MISMGIQMERDTISVSPSNKYNKNASQRVYRPQIITKPLESLELDESSSTLTSPQYSTFNLSDSQEDCDEILPSYECTVEQEGYVHIKQERNEDGLANGNINWVKVYLKIQGTKVTLDHGAYSKSISSFFAAKCLPSYNRTLPIENAQLLPATEYSEKHPYTFRMVLANKEQILIRSESSSAAIQWSESLRAAINITPDIDNRKEIHFKMPKTIYCP